MSYCPREKDCAHSEVIRIRSDGTCADCGTKVHTYIRRRFRRKGSEAAALARRAYGGASRV